jgi:hypothetical protein
MRSSLVTGRNRCTCNRKLRCQSAYDATYGKRRLLCDDQFEDLADGSGSVAGLQDPDPLDVHLPVTLDCHPSPADHRAQLVCCYVVHQDQGKLFDAFKARGAGLLLTHQSTMPRDCRSPVNASTDGPLSGRPKCVAPHAG